MGKNGSLNYFSDNEEIFRQVLRLNTITKQFTTKEFKLGICGLVCKKEQNATPKGKSMIHH